MRTVLSVLGLACCCALPALLLTGSSAKTGPETEKRFPPLKVPAAFKATLFACDPLIEYPSVIAIGPRPGTLFVGIDYMTGLGTEIIRRSEIRLLEDTDHDGYADKISVVAKGFNSIQGLAYHDGAVYVMHAPFLTALRDTDKDKLPDERKHLITGLGLPPEKNPVRLHCANGVVVGHDGWLYLALGDHGCDVRRPEGDRLVLVGGGILRCRPDGKDLHIFATGLRNIYDVALDDKLNVFLRDNENDGGDYMNRQYHSFFGADHGYPYLYYERPAEALPPLADLGRGSSAGGVCYLETTFPAEYRGNLFWCEWGRAVMRAVPRSSGSSFAPLKEIEFAASPPNDPYGFHPTDLVVGHDGSLFVSDWADGQRPKRGRGRIYRIASTAKAAAPSAKNPPKSSPDQWLHDLDSRSYYQRVAAQDALERLGRKVALARVRDALERKSLGVHGRLHALWILARLGGADALEDLLKLARSDPDSSVQAQAVRAVADLTDPGLTQHRLDATRAPDKLAAQLADLAVGRDPQVVLEIVIALGRLGWSDAPQWLRNNLANPDAALKHAAMQTMRRSRNWSALLKFLDLPEREPIRALALQALADQYNTDIAGGLINRLDKDADPGRRLVYADWLARIYKKPGPWVYWGYRPPPRPANSVAWDSTRDIAYVLDRTLADPDRGVRWHVLRRMQRENVPTRPATLAKWLLEDRDSTRVAAVLEAVRAHPAYARREALLSVLRDSKHVVANRLTALDIVVKDVEPSKEGVVFHHVRSLEDGPVLAESIKHLGRRPQLKPTFFLMQKVASQDPAVRAAALLALAELRRPEARQETLKLLNDPDVRVRRAAAFAVEKLGLPQAADALLKLAGDPDAELRRACLDSLRLLREPRVVPLAVVALSSADTEVVALRCLEQLGGPDQALAVVDLTRRHPTTETLLPVARMLTRWGRENPARRAALEKLLAEVQGVSGNLVRWQVAGPLSREAASKLEEKLFAAPKDPRQAFSWTTYFGEGTESRITGTGAAPKEVWLAHSEIIVPEKSAAQFLAAANGKIRIWLDGKLAYERAEPRPYLPDSDRFDASLDNGPHRIAVQLTCSGGPASFHLRFRKKSSSATHEQFTQLALSRPGDPERGKKLFLDTGKSQCLKCHHLDNQGERIGPDLTGIGQRFSRIYLIESLLDPSRSIAPSYESLLVELKDGRVLTGLRLAETAATLTLADQEGKKQDLPLAAIESRRAVPRSIMPENLERQFTADEFVDLIAFLVSRK